MSKRLIAPKLPTTTDFEVAYTVTVPQNRCELSHVLLANVANTDVKYWILHVLPDGSQDESGAVAWGTTLPGDSNDNSHIPIPLDIPLHNIGETIVVKVSVASGINFMFYGDDLDS